MAKKSKKECSKHPQECVECIKEQIKKHEVAIAELKKKLPYNPFQWNPTYIPSQISQSPIYTFTTTGTTTCKSNGTGAIN